jgi:iron complex transport system ATP-binding protein
VPAIQLQANNMTWQVDNKIIVDDVSLSVYRGETLGIIGPNGAGKTSLLKCLYSENQLSSGDVMLDGVAIKNI